MTPKLRGRGVSKAECSQKGKQHAQVLESRPILSIPTALSLPFLLLCRELLTAHRVPGLLLGAMKVAVKKQRKKIKAKMLGTPEEAESR